MYITDKASLNKLVYSQVDRQRLAKEMVVQLSSSRAQNPSRLSSKEVMIVKNMAPQISIKIHLFNSYVLSTHSVPGTALGTGNV